MQKILKKRGGFSLVEVLVVVVIIAILAAIAVPIYLNYVESARASEAQEAIGNIIADAKVDFFLAFRIWVYVVLHAKTYSGWCRTTTFGLPLISQVNVII